MNQLPSFFVVGASKAGTTATCQVLASHPNICFSNPKEPNFFSEFDTDLAEIPPEQLLEYQKRFPVEGAHQVLGEGSVKYLNSPRATYWINHYNPSAKIIIFLRNPLQRVVSLYEMYRRLGIMKMSPKEAFNVDSYVVRQCLLYDHIMRYVNTFSRDQVLIMIFSDFLEHREQTFAELCNFIGVEKTAEIHLPQRNKGGVPKSKALGFLSNRKLVKVGKKILPSSQRTQVDNLIKQIFFNKLKLGSHQQAELKPFFYPDVEKIGHLIDRNLCQEWQLH